jgi:hypothetical protein
MASFTFRVVSPLTEYLDEAEGAGTLAARPATLDGKILGLLPNWRPASVPLLKELGELLQARFKLKETVMEPRMIEAPLSQGRLSDGIVKQLEQLSRRADVVIVATAD